MTAKVRITGNGSSKAVYVGNIDSLPNGLMTYTHPYESYQYDAVYLNNESFGNELAVDPATGGTSSSTLIFDGDTATGWVGTTVVGDAGDFLINSNQVFSGTNSLDATGSANNDTWGLSTASAINLLNVTSIQFRLYIENWPTSGTKNIRIQAFNASASVSNLIDISSYVNTQAFNQWQLVIIPVQDLNLSSSQVDEIRFTTVDVGSGTPPDYYIDSIFLVTITSGTGGDNVVYSFVPNFGDKYKVDSINITGLTNGVTEVNLLEFFGISALSEGCELVFSDHANNASTTFNFATLFDLVSRGNTSVTTFENSTNTAISLDIVIPDNQLFIDGTLNQRIDFIVNDDLSGIERLTCSVTVGKVT